MPALITIAEMGVRARAAATILAQAPTAQKSAGLRAGAAAIRNAADVILAANRDDMVAGAANGMSQAFLDRLKLDEARLEGIATAVEHVADLPDPVGQVMDQAVRPNGLNLARVRVPLGVVGIIYESRPNVTVDAGVLCLMSGNAAILRGGSDAINSARALHRALIKGVASAGLPEDAIQLVQNTDRARVGEMLAAQGLIDIIIPRGGKTLVARVQNDARVPVLAHLDGNCHTYIDGAADPAMALNVTVNAKMRRTGICGATETVLIHRDFAAPQPILDALIARGCALRGDPAICALDARITPATPEDWDTEYEDSILAIAQVESAEAAIAHIARHSSHHTDAIITEDGVTAERFLNAVDSAIVMWNASTQFADGGEFGLGAEIGIATGRLHARGPVALEGLTTYKWVVRGTGQVRP